MTGQHKSVSRLLASILFTLVVFSAACPGAAQTTSGIITTVAGNGAPGISGDGGPATEAAIGRPSGLVFDHNGNLYFSDSDNHRVRKIDANGVISTFAGAGQGFGGDGGPATLALLNSPADLASDAAGNIYIADSGNGRIRRVGRDGIIQTLAGGGPPSATGDGIPAISAYLRTPTGVALDSTFNIYVVEDDLVFGRIRKVTPDGTISTVTTAFGPRDIAISTNGDLYVTEPAMNFDHPNGGVYRVSANGSLTAVVTGMSVPGGLTFDTAGRLLVSESATSPAFNPRVLRADTVPSSGEVFQCSAPSATIVAGSASGQGYAGDGGPATAALLDTPLGLTVDASGNIYIADSHNKRIRRVTPSSNNNNAFEPQLTIHLQPGFYIAEVTLAQGAANGFWGLEVLASGGQLSGGLDSGGALAGALPGFPSSPGFAGFYLPTPQTVTATATASRPVGLLLLDSNRSTIASGSGPLQAALQPGFYIMAVITNPGPPLNYSLSVSSDFFSGGIDVGGCIAPGISGFGAFYLPVEQDVSMHMIGRNTYGASGAGSLVLTLRDANRNVIQQVGP
jgi:sugar lactone lactonase YvrE